MTESRTKPRLLFFQYKYDRNLPVFLLTHAQEHVTCLSEFFDVTVVREDCDYQQVCDRYQPEMVLFEGGVNHASCTRLRIANTHRHPQIPKVGLHHGDSFCDARAGFLSDMDHWGIETYFSISTMAAEHTPEIADRLFSWPVFFDPETYHDYGAWKSIPVFVSGNTNALYPWRRKILQSLPDYYPSLIWPHPGYQPRTKPMRLLVGADYARTINSSWFVPACGTVAKELVRKHLEIPACRSCLLTERTPVLEAAGFVDMKNCVFVDERDVLDKVGYLLQNEDELRRIIDAGYELVHSRHTLKQRDQLFQWFQLRRNLKAGERIVQTGPFGKFVTVPAASSVRTGHLAGDGLHLVHLRQGDANLWEGKYEEAKRSYTECMNYMKWMPEPRFKMALCSLYSGDAKEALSWLERPLHFILNTYNAQDPDPVEWAYFIVAALCMGKIDEAVTRSEQFSWLHHSELDRARWATRILSGESAATVYTVAESQRRRTLHPLPERSLQEWTEQICMMLRKSGRNDLATKLADATSGSSSRNSHDQGAGIDQGTEAAGTGADSTDEHGPNQYAASYFRRRLFFGNLRTKMKSGAVACLRGLEGKFGYFLPYEISESRNDRGYRVLGNVAGKEPLRTALLLGAARGSYETEAILDGLTGNAGHPSVFCLGRSGRRWFCRDRRDRNSTVRWFELGSDDMQSSRRIEEIAAQNQIDAFDLVLFNGSNLSKEFSADALSKVLAGAKIAILCNLDRPSCRNWNEFLVKRADFSLEGYDPDLRGGYAIFARHSSHSAVAETVAVSQE
jgi:hypothetical protein